MGKQSTRENKTIYQICREEAGLTRLEASEKMTAVSDSKIEKFEYEMQEPTPYDIIQMADAYGRPDLCNYYCSHKCEIGHRYVPEVEVSDLSNIILETIASLNEINPLTTRLIQIARDGKISDDEIKDFAFISNKLDEISLAIDSLNLWVDKTAGEQGLNIELLREEKKNRNKYRKNRQRTYLWFTASFLYICCNWFMMYSVLRISFFHLMSGIIDSILHHPIHNKSIKKIICKG